MSLDVTLKAMRKTEVYSGNATHNLVPMAKEAGIYMHLWGPGEIGLTKAGDLIAPLRAGLDVLVGDPDRFKKLNPSNGWGDYDGFVRFVSKYLAACTENPDAELEISR